VLESTSSGTRLTGPKLDLEVAPVRMRLMPTKKLFRVALVDC